MYPGSSKPREKAQEFDKLWTKAEIAHNEETYFFISLRVRRRNRGTEIGLVQWSYTRLNINMLPRQFAGKRGTADHSLADRDLSHHCFPLVKLVSVARIIKLEQMTHKYLFVYLFYHSINKL